MTQRDVPDAIREKWVMTSEEWRAHGISRQLIRSLARSGDLVPVRRGAYATKRAVQWAGADDARRHVLRILAVRSAVGRHAIASYHSAAILHHLSLLKPLPGDAVTVTLPPGKAWNRARPADVVFRSAELPAGHLARAYNLPVTTVARTVADLARTLPFTDAVVVADSALCQDKVTKAELNEILGTCARWPGVKQARRVVEFADERAESPLESAARVVFDACGLDAPELQATIFSRNGVFRVDFLWPGQRVIAEADGLMKYNDRRDYIKQLERDRLLQDAGYKVVHFTWEELFKSPEVVIDRIRRALAAATPY